VKTEADNQLDSLAVVVAKASPNLDEEQQGIALATYRRLAEGTPAPASEIAARAGVSVGRIRAVLAAWPGVFRDRDGRVVGFWGLTIHRLSPTHRLFADGRDLFAWCAWDTLFLPGIFDETLAVESLCRATGTNISLRVSPSEIVETSHPDAVVSFLLPDKDFDADIIQSFCHFVYFFATERDGQAWTAQHPGTFLLSLQDAFELGRRVNHLNFPVLAARR
jgi:alkylmercury lyase